VSVAAYSQKNPRDCKKGEHLFAGLRTCRLPPLNADVSALGKFLRLRSTKLVDIEPGNVPVIIFVAQFAYIVVLA
jgi:hypothetical protein